MTTTAIGSTKKIFKNSFYLFLRSIISLIIGLYASRILLAKLGIDDYGVYNVVGGVVATFTSIRSFFASSIQRFINYYKGLGDDTLINKVFTTGVLVQIAISVVVFILLELFGPIVINHLNINDIQRDTSQVIFQFSVITVIVSILTVPYDAIITAYEKMNVYAFFSIIDSVLKLVIVYLISKGPYNQLINYSLLLMLETLFMRFINSLYCKINFPTATFRYCYDVNLIKKMGAFAGWNFCGNTGYSLMHEGINFVFNAVGGVAVNAARALAYQVMSALNNLIGNINVAFKPQTNAIASTNDTESFYRLLILNAKTMMVLYLILMIPFTVFADIIIKLWIGYLPNYVEEILLAISLYYLIRSVHPALDLYFNSIGCLKYYQITELLYFIANIPLAIILMNMGFPFWSVFIAMAVVELFSHLSVLIIGHKKNNLDISKYIKEIYMPLFRSIICFVPIVLFLKSEWTTISDGWIIVLIKLISVAILTMGLSCLLIFSKKENMHMLVTLTNTIKK